MNAKPHPAPPKIPVIERLDTPVSVALAYRHRSRDVVIALVFYDGREYPIRRVTHRYKEQRGKTLMHVFCLDGEGTHLRVMLDTDTLHWSLLEIRFYADDAPAIQPETLHALAH